MHRTFVWFLLLSMDQELLFVSRSPDETVQLASALAAHLSGGEYISLEGELGAGKTLCSRSICHTLGVTGPVTSPTFVLQKIYPATGQRIASIVHYDFYRIGSYEELVDLGFEDHDEGTVVLAEWGEKFVAQFPRPAIRFQISGSGEDPREIRIRNAPKDFRFLPE